MTAEYSPRGVDDLAGLRRIRPQPGDDAGIVPGRDEADVLAIRLLGDGQPEPRRCRPYRVLVGHAAQRKQTKSELLGRRGEQKPALVACRVRRAMQFRPARSIDPPDVVSGRETIGAEPARQRDQVGKFYLGVALHAGHRRLAARVAVGERRDDRAGEARLRVHHVMRDAEVVGHAARVVDILPGTTGALPAGRGTMVVELQA